MVDLFGGAEVEVDYDDLFVGMTVDSELSGLEAGVVLSVGARGPAGQNGQDGQDGQDGAPGEVSLAQLNAASTADRARANHTGTQAQSTVVNLVTDLAGKVPATRAVSAGTGLTGGGNLSADRSLAVVYGTGAGTSAQGDDARIVGAAQKANNLSDLPSPSTARTNLGLGTAATKNTGTTSGEVPLLSTGNVLPVALLATGTPDGTKFIADDGTLKTPASGGGGSSAPLARVVRNATAPSAYTISNGTPPADLDATNLTISVTFPASGLVRLCLEGVATITTSGSHYWSIRTGSTNVPGTERAVIHASTAAATARAQIDDIYISGTPGATVVYKWAQRGSPSSGNASTVYGGSSNEFTANNGNNRGPLTMTAWAA